MSRYLQSREPLKSPDALQAQGDMLNSTAWLLNDDLANRFAYEAPDSIEGLGHQLGKVITYYLQKAGADLNEIKTIPDGIADCTVAMRGVRHTLAQGLSTQRFTADEKLAIAHRSFGVLRYYARYRSAVESGELKGAAYSLDPDLLELVEEPEPFVRFNPERLHGNSARAPRYTRMPCPAFMGGHKDAPRLPVQLWQQMAHIFYISGEFGPVNIPQDPDFPQLVRPA